MNHPYRTMYITNAATPPKRRRSLAKTIVWKWMILFRGKWRDRYGRCRFCGYVFPALEYKTWMGTGTKGTGHYVFRGTNRMRYRCIGKDRAGDFGGW